MTDPSLQTLLDGETHAALEKCHVPSFAALIQVDGKVVAQSAAGVRRIDESTPIQLSDVWHLGSCTKAMTATLIARLVEQGMMNFDAPLETVLPELASRMDDRMKRATLAHLLNHTCGLPSLTIDLGEYEEFMHALDGRAVVSATPSRESVNRLHAQLFDRGSSEVVMQRWSVAAHYLSQPPSSDPGATFQYSNTGYIVAAAIAESRTGKSWEELLRREIFTTLSITTGGFGPPGEAGARPADQPRGHTREDNKPLIVREPDDPEADNLPVLGPAGTVHMSLRDWVRFAQDQLDGHLGDGKLLTRESYERLHRPGLSDYAFGWVVRSDGQRRPTLMEHGGSNGAWCVQARILPRQKAIVLTATNAGTLDVCRASEQVTDSLVATLKSIEAVD